METFSALLAICAGNSPVTGEFPAQRSVTRCFGVFSDLRLNKRLSKKSWDWCLRGHRAHYVASLMIYHICVTSIIVLNAFTPIDFMSALPQAIIWPGTSGMSLPESMYREFSNIRRTKSQNLNDSRLVLRLSPPNTLKPGVKSRMKMYLEQRRQAH